jgi:hypothetical protein
MGSRGCARCRSRSSVRRTSCRSIETKASS